MKEEYTKIEGWDRKMGMAPLCGSPAELWEHKLENGTYRKVVMCSNGGDGLDDEGCPMYMPPEGFYKATKVEALSTWNTRSET